MKAKDWEGGREREQKGGKKEQGRKVRREEEGRKEGTEKEMKGYQLSETSVGIYYS